MLTFFLGQPLRTMGQKTILGNFRRGTLRKQAKLQRSDDVHVVCTIKYNKK